MISSGVFKNHALSSKIREAALAATKFMTFVEAEPQKNYHIRITENAHVLDDRDIHDPFITTRIVPRGWRAAWLVLRGKLTFTVKVTGTDAAHRAVFDSDYTLEPPRPAMPGGLRATVNIPVGREGDIG